MKKTLGLGFYKTFAYVLLLILFFVVLIVAILGYFGAKHEIASSIEHVKYAWDKHRLSSCVGEEVKFSIAEKEKSLSNFKVFKNCSYAINSYYPDVKGEYFGIIDTRTNTKFYIDDNKKYVLGDPSILGEVGNLVFIEYCYEGCGGIEMFDLSESQGNYDVIRPYALGDFLTRNKVNSTDLFVVNQRVIIIDEHRIYELNPNNFTLTVLKEILKDRVFGHYYPADNGFRASYSVKDSRVMYKIFNKEDEMDMDSPQLPKPVEVGFLEVK